MFMNETCLTRHKQSSCPQLWPYPCDKCGHRYMTEEKLNEHILSKCGTEKVFVCDVCNRSYLYKRQLVEHMTPVCKNSLSFSCDVCNYTFKSQERLNEHVLSKCDREKVFTCDTCKKQYILKGQLIEHLTPICRSLRRLKCEHCEMTFKKMFNLNKHNASVHGIGNEMLCDVCGEVVNGYEQFKCHKKKHRFKNISGFNMYDLNEKSYLCKLCGKCLKSKVTLRRHLSSHTDSKPLICKICDKAVGKFSFRVHMKMHNGVASDLSCRLCQKTFGTKKDLERHMGTHSIEKPHFCRDCGKSFASMDQLRTHSAFHTGLKSHFCNICGNGYLNTKALRRHMQRVHSDKKRSIQGGRQVDMFAAHQEPGLNYETKCDLKPYVCNDCETCFESLQSFLDHTEVESSEQPYICNTCGKFFSKISCFESHLLIHPNVLSCEKCGERFADSLSLGLHSAICGYIENVENDRFDFTPEDKLSVCSQCGQEFDNLYDLTCHALSHIGDAPLKLQSVEVSLLSENCHKYTQNKMLSYPGVKMERETLACNESGTCLANSFKQNNMLVDSDNNLKNCESKMLYSPVPVEGVKPPVCEECGRTFSDKRCLKRHLLTVHSSPNTKIESCDVPGAKSKPPTCQQCGKTFSDPRNLKRHVETVHSYEKSAIQHKGPFTCDECGKIFHQRYKLERHKTVHSTETPFTCFVCNKSFKKVKVLEHHMLELHGMPTSATVFPCNTCGKLFAVKSRLENHTRLHTGEKIKCEECGRSFSKTCSLKTHMQTVHGKPAKCNLCNLVCLSTIKLVEHVRFIHKDVIDQSAPFEALIASYQERNSPLQANGNEGDGSNLETKTVELKLPLNDENMLMFEAYESLLLEACPMEPPMSVSRVNGDNHQAAPEEELVKLEYVLGS